MLPVSGEQDFCKLIQALNACNFIMVQFDFGAWYIFHPWFFYQNKPFERLFDFSVMLKFFQADFGNKEENCLFPKTLRFRIAPAQQGRLIGIMPMREGII